MRLAKLIFKILFAVFGWLSSAIALWIYYIDESMTTWFYIFCIIIGLIAILYVGIEIHGYYKDKKKVFVHSSDTAVHAYLYKWIKNGGRTVIFTRDFTWADCNAEMRELLEAKAKRNELIVCLYKPTETTNKLKQLGAEIYIHHLRDLKSRFTITNYGRNCPQVTVGSKRADGKYINERYDMQSNPNVYNTFVELFESARATSITRSF